MSMNNFTSMTTITKPEFGWHWEPGRCPNVGRACNCPGFCHPKLVRDDDYKPRHRRDV